jgi:hypothetical protein
VPDHPAQPLIGDHASKFVIETGQQGSMSPISPHHISVDK